MKLPAHLVLISILVCGCDEFRIGDGKPVPDHPLYRPSPARVQMTGHETFADYVSATKAGLEKYRVFLTGDAESEKRANLPFEIRPAKNPLTGPTGKTKGILLVHGLGDSPGTFVDLAQEFAARGFLVRTVLLPGHGTRPADLMGVSADQWQKVVEEQTALLKRAVDDVYLGGFSTGGNIVTELANGDGGIRGLFLFSPAFMSDETYDFLSPAAALFQDWIFIRDTRNYRDYLRYNVVPMNGFAQYYWTTVNVRLGLYFKTFDRPVFIAVSQHDSVVNVKQVLSLFEKKFTHPASRLIWFGDPPTSADRRVITYSGRLPKHRISNFSHMSLMFKMSNPYYGVRGAYRMCRNNRRDDHYEKCLKGGPVWYSAWGYVEEDKIHARLTFNPWFDKMLGHFDDVIRAEPQLQSKE